jgi:hypothetical protein
MPPALAFQTQLIARQHSKDYDAIHGAEFNTLWVGSDQVAGEFHRSSLIVELFSSRPEPRPGNIERHGQNPVPIFVVCILT